MNTVKKFMKTAVLTAALAGMACSALAAGPLAAKVNDVTITAQEVEAYIQAQSPSGPKLKPGHATTQLIGQELLAQEAVRRGQDKKAGRQALASGMVKEFIAANPLGEDDVKREYERVKALQTQESEYKLRMIVVKTEAEAKAILAGLDAGKPFESFVAQSIDANSKRDGGAVDWMKAGEMTAPYAHAVKSMKAGTVAKEPLRESYGFVVLKLDDVRGSVFPPYAEVRDQIAQVLVSQRNERLLKPLADKATIQQFEGYANTTFTIDGKRDHGPYVRKIDPQP